MDIFYPPIKKNRVVWLKLKVSKVVYAIKLIKELKIIIAP